MGKKNKKSTQHFNAAAYDSHVMAIYSSYERLEQSPLNIVRIHQFAQTISQFESYLESCDEPSIAIRGWIELGLYCLLPIIKSMTYQTKNDFYYLRAKEANAKAKKIMEENPELDLPECISYGFKSSQALYKSNDVMMNQYRLVAALSQKPNWQGINTVDKAMLTLAIQTESNATKIKRSLSTDENYAIDLLNKYNKILTEYYDEDDLKKLIDLCNSKIADIKKFRATMECQILIKYQEIGATFLDTFWEPLQKLYPLERSVELLSESNFGSQRSQNFQLFVQLNLKFVSILKYMNDHFKVPIQSKFTKNEVEVRYAMLQKLSTRIELAKNEHELRVKELQKFYSLMSQEAARRKVYLAEQRKKRRQRSEMNSRQSSDGKLGKQEDKQIEANTNETNQQNIGQQGSNNDIRIEKMVDGETLPEKNPNVPFTVTTNYQETVTDQKNKAGIKQESAQAEIIHTTTQKPTTEVAESGPLSKRVNPQPEIQTSTLTDENKQTQSKPKLKKNKQIQQKGVERLGKSHDEIGKNSEEKKQTQTQFESGQHSQTTQKINSPNHSESIENAQPVNEHLNTNAIQSKESKKNGDDLYDQGNYKEALDVTRQQLPSNYEKIPLNFEQIRLVILIADCYKAIAYIQQQKTKTWYSKQLISNAIKHYEIALASLEILLKNCTDIEREEILEYQSIVNAALQELNPKNQQRFTPSFYGRSKESYQQKNPNHAEHGNSNPANAYCNIELTDSVQKYVDLCSQDQHEVYIVGGTVRDFLLNYKPNDVDLATTYPIVKLKEQTKPNQLIGKTSPILKISSPQQEIDISPLYDYEFDETNFQELELDNYSKTKYTPTFSVEKDSRHRDFTINALYVNAKTKKLLDPTGLGKTDIDKKLIRTVIDPDQSFEDDPIRMLRAVKFSLKLGFEIEANTKSALIRSAHKILRAERSRLRLEIEKLFWSYGTQALQAMQELHLLEQLFPKVSYSISPEGESIHKIMLETMFKTFDNYWTRKQHSNSPVFFCVMYWGEIQELLTNIKFNSPESVYNKSREANQLIHKIIYMAAQQFNLSQETQQSMQFIFQDCVSEILYPNDSRYQAYADLVHAEEFKQLWRFAKEKSSSKTLSKDSMFAPNNSNSAELSSISSKLEIKIEEKRNIV